MDELKHECESRCKQRNPLEKQFGHDVAKLEKLKTKYTEIGSRLTM